MHDVERDPSPTIGIYRKLEQPLQETYAMANVGFYWGAKVGKTKENEKKSKISAENEKQRKK